jgi:hypothetical protein
MKASSGTMLAIEETPSMPVLWTDLDSYQLIILRRIELAFLAAYFLLLHLFLIIVHLGKIYLLGS